MISQACKLTCAPPLWRWYSRLIKVPPLATADTERPLIFACLHRDILPAIIHVKAARPSLLVSRSPDGEILIRTLGETAYGFVRGATGENGGRAFVNLRRELENGRSIGVAVDGPKGPYGVINEGVLQLSRLAGVPIAPLRARAARAFQLRTWDRTVVPRPFSRVEMCRGADLVVARSGGEAGLERARRELAAFFGVEGVNCADC